MKISPISLQNTTHNNTFKSLSYIPDLYTDIYGVVRTTQNTTEKRNDLDYDKLAKILETRFKSFDTVNICPMNVSDGTEAYCVANAIIRNEGWNTFKKKYAPVNASDISRNIIEKYPQKGILHLYYDEIELFKGLEINILEESIKDDYKNYVLFQTNFPDKLYRLNPEYTKHFDFKIIDLQQRLNEFEDKGNSVIFIRNCLKQSFTDNSFTKIIKQAAKTLKGKSLFISGGYDTKEPAIKQALQDYFNEIESNIWELKKTHKFFTKNPAMNYFATLKKL